MTPLAFTAQCVAICNRGFDNHFAWMAWLKKRRRQIATLPPPLRKQVLEAHANSGPKEFSRKASPPVLKDTGRDCPEAKAGEAAVSTSGRGSTTSLPPKAR